ncbi:hypothetical protein SAY87_023779 [Trapa incisa]|uniref:Uncharacterized protein n=1 Tax=Trapa incisa TaxID=236973 RepID=A0AAN7QUL3_9MYRT|nr:hypothetical protein SAY87_023779 [Trapa incisa]
MHVRSLPIELWDDRMGIGDADKKFISRKFFDFPFCPSGGFLCRIFTTFCSLSSACLCIWNFGSGLSMPGRFLFHANMVRQSYFPGLQLRSHLRKESLKIKSTTF